MKEQVQQAIRSELSLQQMNNGYESFEEADDFDIDDPEDLPISSYEDEANLELMPPDPDMGPTTDDLTPTPTEGTPSCRTL